MSKHLENNAVQSRRGPENNSAFAVRMFTLVLLPLAILCVDTVCQAQDLPAVSTGVRGLVTRAKQPPVMDGKLTEWELAFCTPLHYNHGQLNNRAAQVYYAWDENALYLGLRALDRSKGNTAPLPALANGDAVELYLDTRSGVEFRSKDWTDGAIHLFFSPFEGIKLNPRWVMRRGIATSETKLTGVEVAATSTTWGYECEFKLPWSNFPAFKPTENAVFGMDFELCSADGAARTDRTFAYGSPLSVQQPASQAKVQLVDHFDPDHLAAVGPATFPCWVETPWTQPQRAQVQAVVGIPPMFASLVGLVTFRVHGADGGIVKTMPGKIEPFGPEGLGFHRAVARWSIDDFAPNSYFITAVVASSTGKALVHVAPRMVHEAQMTGR